MKRSFFIALSAALIVISPVSHPYVSCAIGNAGVKNNFGVPDGRGGIRSRHEIHKEEVIA
jgi:hypothetical protein